MATRIDIIDRALSRLGETRLIVETAPGAETHIDIYNSIVGSILSSYPWTFSTTTRRLIRSAAAPFQFWDYAFDLPADMLGWPRAAYDSNDRDRPFTDWELQGKQLLTDAEKIWLTFTKDTPPAHWPGHFAEMITLALMAEMALSIREDPALRDKLRADVYGSDGMMGEGGMLGQSKFHDSSGHPNEPISFGGGPLVDGRF